MQSSTYENTLEIPSFKNVIFKQLQFRNQLQSDCFQKLIFQHSLVTEQNRELFERNIELQKENARLTYNNTDLQKKFSSIVVESDPRTISELEKKIMKLQEELTSSYKRNSDNATTLLDLNQQLKELQEDNKSKELEIEEWKQNILILEEKKQEIGRRFTRKR